MLAIMISLVFFILFFYLTESDDNIVSFIKTSFFKSQ